MSAWCDQDRVSCFLLCIFFHLFIYILMISCICFTLSDENSWAWKLCITSLKESHYIYTCITLCCIWPVRCVKDVKRRDFRGPIGRGSNILSCIQCFSSDTISAATCCVLHACLIENNGVKELCQMSAEWIKEKWPHTHTLHWSFSPTWKNFTNQCTYFSVLKDQS